MFLFQHHNFVKFFHILPNWCTNVVSFHNCGLLYEDLNISTEEQNIEVDSVDETPGWLVVYCMRIYDCINWYDSNITFSKTEK